MIIHLFPSLSNFLKRIFFILLSHIQNHCLESPGILLSFHTKPKLSSSPATSPFPSPLVPLSQTYNYSFFFKFSVGLRAQTSTVSRIPSPSSVFCHFPKFKGKWPKCRQLLICISNPNLFQGPRPILVITYKTFPSGHSCRDFKNKQTNTPTHPSYSLYLTRGGKSPH